MGVALIIQGEKLVQDGLRLIEVQPGSDGAEVVVAVPQLGVEGGPVRRLEGHLDTQLLQLGGDQLCLGPGYF